MWAYLNNLAVLITINAILAVTLNFVLGYAGIFSMAHAAFFGIGAYTAALVAIKLGGGFQRGDRFLIAARLHQQISKFTAGFRPCRLPTNRLLKRPLSQFILTIQT